MKLLNMGSALNLRPEVIVPSTILILFKYLSKNIESNLAKLYIYIFYNFYIF